VPPALSIQDEAKTQFSAFDGDRPTRGRLVQDAREVLAGLRGGVP
jgi:hypothetical protein